MASTAACLRGALVVAMFAMLLHSSMGQQPPPASSCSDQCTSNCTQRCQSLNSDASNCNSALRVYGGCYTECTRNCKGNCHTHSSCQMGSCSASSCGQSCARSCCESCTIAAQRVTYSCTTEAEGVKNYCMPSCMVDCVKYNCGDNESAPPMP
ncbi:hypothetical protein SEVIR_3G308745v4 [Setaria viridis]|uniref:TNFR-Cys domain-containing protein n=1 Tax=Setaria viridis TaxID=4556 RepID=A0A4U6VFG1_SETVI|nr:keratin-associated protein 10-6-like [Setaria viridis]XP_034586692.1 keratin-associated protein 10-6-like [Setaria viridis]TKW28281.1 hypothetical protein SEVIR_3G308800v2 [Setaria viridis]